MNPARHILLLLALPLLAACSASEADAGPDWGAAALAPVDPDRPAMSVWAADHELFSWATMAAERIETATGVRVSVSETNYDATPLFWSSGIAESGWAGYAQGTVADPDGGQWVGISPHVRLEDRATAVLHELLHELGAQHVKDGEGIMARALNAIPGDRVLTEADLQSLCRIKHCSVFQPETPGALATAASE
jgi:hypothetical protein